MMRKTKCRQGNICLYILLFQQSEIRISTKAINVNQQIDLSKPVRYLQMMFQKIMSANEMTALVCFEENCGKKSQIG